jgi:HemY protein
MLMAEIEEGENGDQGRVRQWLTRAFHAPRDPAWVADGHVYERWAPVSPVTGRVDAFEWKVPAELLPSRAAEIEPETDEPGEIQAAPTAALPAASTAVVATQAAVAPQSLPEPAKPPVAAAPAEKPAPPRSEPAA